MTKKWLTSEQRAAMVADFQAGQPMKEIAQKYGRSVDGVRWVVRRAGLPPRGPGIRPREQFVTPGQVFGRWTVMKPVAPGGYADNRALCRCECGSVDSVRVRSLLGAISRSCGCLKRDASKERFVAMWGTHGLSAHPLYKRWALMMVRCHDSTARNYDRYGGRGIKVHPSLCTIEGYVRHVEALPVPAGLVGNPEAIPYPELSHDQRETLLHSRKFSIDRVNNDGDYEPGNLRWADAITQRANQSRQATRLR